MLEDEADAPLLDRERRGVVAVESKRALAHGFEAGDQAQERGLARARGSEQGQKLPRRHRKIDRSKNLMGAEAFRDASHLDPARRKGATRERRRAVSRAGR